MITLNYHYYQFLSDLQPRRSSFLCLGCDSCNGAGSVAVQGTAMAKSDRGACKEVAAISVLYASSDAKGPGCMLPHVSAHCIQMAFVDLVVHADLQTQPVSMASLQYIWPCNFPVCATCSPSRHALCIVLHSALRQRHSSLYAYLTCCRALQCLKPNSTNERMLLDTTHIQDALLSGSNDWRCLCPVQC